MTDDDPALTQRRNNEDAALTGLWIFDLDFYKDAAPMALDDSFEKSQKLLDTVRKWPDSAIKS